MFKTIVPVGINLIESDGDVEKLIRDLKDAGTTDILITIAAQKEEFEAKLPRARKAADHIEENDINVMGIWICTFSAFPNQPDRYNYVSQRDGKFLNTVVCPTDESCLESICSELRKISEHGFNMALLDDDFRVQVIASDARCFCESHMKEYSRLLGEEISRDTLCQKVFSATVPNKYRDVWLKVNREILLNFCKRLRNYADTLGEDFNIGLCAGPSVWWEVGESWEGPVEMVRILAGKNQPYLRLIGGPYWNIENDMTFNMRTEEIIDYTRRQAAYCKKVGIPCYAEGDSHPRMRHYLAASVLTNFDLAIRCDGNFSGIQKYFYTYIYPINFEEGYIKAAKDNRERAKRMSELFAKGKTWGLNPYKPFQEIRYLPLNNSKEKLDLEQMLVGNNANKFLNYNNFPVSFEEDAPVVVLGEHAQIISKEELSKGAILDYVAAEILRDRGIDVGLKGNGRSIPKIAVQKVFEILPNDQKITMFWEEKWFPTNPKPDVKIISHMRSDETTYPGAFLYDNKKGEKFAVLPYDMSENVFNNIFIHYYRQQQLSDMYTFITGQTPKIQCLNQPYIYMIVKESPNCLAVGVWNFSNDSLTEVEFNTDIEYFECEFEYCGGRLEGKKCIVDKIIAHEFCALIFKKN